MQESTNVVKEPIGIVYPDNSSNSHQISVQSRDGSAALNAQGWILVRFLFNN